MSENLLSLRQRIDVIESGYEFLLAYAAQGRETDVNSGSGHNVRDYLSDMKNSMLGLGDLCKEAARNKQADSINEYITFLETVDNDALQASSLLSMVLTQDNISSQLIDNLNANVHLRTLLTDLFIIDDILA